MAQLLEEILSRENMILVYKRVKTNKRASGGDGITIEEVDKYLKENWEDIREKIQTAKIKYLNNYDNPWQYTATMETKVFLLSVDEVWPYPLDEYWSYGDGKSDIFK